MVNFKLKITAEMENIASLEPMEGLHDPNFSFYFKLQCENCGETTEKLSCVWLNEQVLIPQSPGVVNLVQKCKLCGRKGDIKLVPAPLSVPLFTNIDSARKLYAVLMGFECRGFVPFDCIFSNSQWKVQASSGTIFEDVDLTSGNWADYDEQGNRSVAILNLQSEFEVVKGWNWRRDEMRSYRSFYYYYYY